MPGCNWDLLALIADIDASGGDVAMKLSLGETLYSGNAAAGSATIVYPRAKGNIVAFAGQSEDGALVNYRFRDQSYMQNFLGGALFQGGQTEACEIDKRVGRCNIPIGTGGQLAGTMTNAAQKLDGIVLMLGKDGTLPEFSGHPFGKLPPGAFWVEANGTTTATADTWTNAPLTFPDYVHDREKHFKILGAVFEGATMLAWRFRFKTGPDVENCPGFIGGDTDQLNCPVYFSHCPEYVGDNPPSIEILCSAGDTAQVGMILLAPI